MSKTRMQGAGDVEQTRRQKAAHKFMKPRRWDKAAYDAAPRTLRDAEQMREAQGSGPARGEDHHAPAMEDARR